MRSQLTALRSQPLIDDARIFLTILIQSPRGFARNSMDTTTVCMLTLSRHREHNYAQINEFLQHTARTRAPRYRSDGKTDGRFAKTFLRLSQLRESSCNAIKVAHTTSLAQYPDKYDQVQPVYMGSVQTHLPLPEQRIVFALGTS